MSLEDAWIAVTVLMGVPAALYLIPWLARGRKPLLPPRWDRIFSLTLYGLLALWWALRIALFFV